MKFKQVFPFILALPMASIVQAATVHYQGTFLGATDVTNQAVQVQQFDSSLGTLQSVSFTLSSKMTSKLTVNNDGDFFVGWDKALYNVTLAGSGATSGISVTANGDNQRVVGTGAVGSAFTTSTMEHVISGPTGSYVFTRSASPLTVTQVFNLAPAAGFEGNGLLSFLLTTQNYDSFSAAGTQTGGVPVNLQQLQTNVAAFVDVTYTYAVPVPAAAWLFGSGLIGLAGMARRRKAA